jgi:hypothetical protein
VVGRPRALNGNVYEISIYSIYMHRFRICVKMHVQTINHFVIQRGSVNFIPIHLSYEAIYLSNIRQKLEVGPVLQVQRT